MRYLLVAVGILFLIGLVTDAMPIDAMIVIAVFVVLAGAGFVGARPSNRVKSLRRAVFFTDSLISYRENVADESPDPGNKSR